LRRQNYRSIYEHCVYRLNVTFGKVRLHSAREGKKEEEEEEEEEEVVVVVVKKRDRELYVLVLVVVGVVTLAPP
jgi:hypothetical protein